MGHPATTGVRGWKKVGTRYVQVGTKVGTAQAVSATKRKEPVLELLEFIFHEGFLILLIR